MLKQKILRAFKTPRKLLTVPVLKTLGRILPDSVYISIQYYQHFGKFPNLKNPKTFNEKLQWLKLHNRKAEYTTMVDKVEAKKWVAERIGEEYIIPTLGVWERAEDIDFDSLPDQFVLKTNHDSGCVIICKDKSKLDKEAARKKLNKSLKRDYYKYGREWPYKNVPRRILAEQYLTEEIVDYKFFCYDGFVESVMVCYDRGTGDTKFYFTNRNWEVLPYNYRGINYPNDFKLPKPSDIDDMFTLASQLSQGLPYARVDFYNINGQIYFGELTFFPDSGLDANILPDVDKYFGQLIKL